MNKKYLRNIDDEKFWINFYKINTVKLNNLEISSQKGSKFTDRLFNCKNNQEIILLKYDILDRENKTISHNVCRLLKRNLNENIPNTNSLIKLLKFEDNFLHPVNLVERTLLCVYASDSECRSLDVNFGDQILLIKTKYYQNSEIILYKEEFTNLETFIFEDKYNEGISL
ncbi:hypothetical protein ACWOAQ_05990 [Helcococcus kunzii]|uniref:hypothetical protein n=1 Tax=Helcococcus kunzii TaxID=40091 RepID=UPI0021A4AAFD|nr:hypothetical protein [Helcococcus kunzii]MCT1796392.1 hypothetical protein [Helcococcus kunzii]MCT1989442.1 hypothetical protein [Helcococcus kunzii]